ncbi:NACHT domain-containing protein [Bacteroidales bacterium OttesenSCG-928-B11]|nr:NACHT domain-containing protein [Bacteroidales bacterium OttesenSCG-928-B11]
MDKKNRVISDAPESNAGDDFHVLWSIRKSLELLNTDNSALKAITVEGVLPKEAKKLDPTGFLFLGVDITEYFGGENFQNANRVIFSQLKYSTRNADANWTINSISKANKNKNDSFSGSIIHRLSCIFTTYLNAYDRDIVLQKVKLKLVTNRNVAKGAISLINDIQTYLHSTTSPTLAKLKSQFPKYEEEIDLLKKASKLKVNDFIDFLKLLDFSDCGIDSRFAQKQKAVEAIVQFAGMSGSQFAELNVFVRDKMMPENRSKNLITEKDVLSFFGFGQVKDLFPAPSQIETCKNYIERKCYSELRNNIINDIKNKFYLHAGAGYGKSTFVNHLTESLPEGSESILFDCYGGGTYSDPSDRRHKHEWGILQIASEMAHKVGTPFLLMQNGMPEQYLRELKKRLQQGVNILKVQNPRAVLLLVIDAADNSLTAANTLNEKSFVADLIQETLPEGCKLLITTRTSRKDLFDFTANEFIPLQIEAFNKDETSVYLKSIRPEVSEKFIETFHQLTNGIPRVQSYTLRTQEANLEEILNPLRPDGKNLNDIFADQIKTASRRLGDQEEARIILKYLANLPRPIPLSILTLVSDIKQEVVMDFIVDLYPGLVLSKEQISFKDEDFETYLKDTYSFNEIDYKIIAENMLNAADENEYCCINLAHFLLKSNNAVQLQQIVLQQTHISAVSEPLQQKQLLIDRTRLALGSANKATDKATFIRLQLLAAETAKTNATLRSILIENADLVALYGISENNKDNYSFDRSWYGAYYAKKAAALSRNPQFHNQAKEYLKEADSWFHWCSRQKKEDYFNRDYRITIEDIKNATEAYLNIFGIDEAIKYISSWQPKGFVFQVIKELTYSLLDQKRSGIVIELLRRNNIHVHIQLSFIQFLSEYGIIPDNIDFDKIVETITHFKGKLSHTLKELIINFCELLALKKYDKQTILTLLQLLGDCIPEHLPRFYQSGFDNKEETTLFDISCRGKSLISILSNTEVTIDDFLPNTVKEKLDLKEYDERKYAEDQKREYNRLYGFALPYYKLRIETYLGIVSRDNFKAIFNTLAKQTKDNWELRHYHYDVVGLFDFIACRFLDILPFVDDKEHLLNQIHDTFLRNKDSKKTHILITTADRISKINTDEIHKLALKFCNQADDIIRNDLLTLDDVNNYYIKATRALNRIDTSFGQRFFLKAINVVHKIDDNAYHQIRAIHSISNIGLPQPSPELAFEFGRFVEYTKTILSGYEHFPMKESLYAIANIDPGSSLAFLCRWDHRKILELDDYAGKLFDKLYEMGLIDGVYNAALWSLSPYFYFDDIQFFQSLEKKLIDFTQQSLVNEKRKFVKQLIWDIKLSSHINWRRSYLNQLKEVLQRNAIDAEIISDLNGYIQKINTLKPEESYTSSYQPDEKEEFDWESFIKDIDFLKVEDIENVIEKIKTGKEDFRHNASSDFIICISSKCSLSQQVLFFEVICEISPSLIGYYNFKSIIKKLLEDWEDNPLVMEWSESNFEKIFKIWLPYLIDEHNDSSLTYYINDLAKTFDIQNEKLAQVVVNSLPDIVSNLSSEDLYRLIDVTSIGLTKEDSQVIIQETIKKWNQPIKNDFADGIFSEELIPASSSDECIANVFRYALGYPDRQMRWKAAHALRRLINYSPKQSILQFLVQNQDKKTCIPFQNKDYTFFWMSSKLYLWMTINRIANENPQKLQSIIQEIINEAINPSQLHLLIQLFVKRTCSILCKAGMMENSEHLLQEIEKPFINDVREILPNITVDKDNWRFNFDHLDTIPYWYNNLGDFFDLGGTKIAALAQDIICDTWHFHGNVHDINHVHTANGDWHLTSNRQGGIPQIENLQTYYEYHAMFCVAGKLLKSKKLKDKGWRTFEEWLSSYATVWENKWLSDLRDPEPFLPIMHQIDSNNENWNTVIDWKEYEDYIGLCENKYLVTNSDIAKHYWKDYENIQVESAFVSVDKAQSLVFTLNDFENYHLYAIPSEEESEHSINEDGFMLKGFHNKIKVSDEGLDDDDTFANDIAKYARIPGEVITRHFNLKISDDFRFSYMPNNAIPITIFENWNDCTDRDSTENRSNGHHFMIDRKSMLEILQKNNFCLLIECVVNRSKEKSYSKGKHKYSEFVSLYLLYPNGKIESTSRNINLREKDY